MNTDKLKLFKSEEEVAHFARVNGYDPEDTDKLIANWKALGQPKKTITKKVYDAYSTITINNQS